MGTYSYDVADPMDFTDQEICEAVDLTNALTAEIVPDDPPTPYELAIETQRSKPRRIRRTSIRARDAAGVLVAGTGVTIDPDHDDNPDMLSVGINVRSDHRENGIATRLFAYVTALALKEGERDSLAARRADFRAARR